MKHILIPTDFSKNSYNAIRYALSFFEETWVTFHLLHVDVTNAFPIINKWTETTETYMIPVQEKSTGSKIKLKRLCQELIVVHPEANHTFCYVYEISTLIVGIRKLVLEKNIDLIVMGTKGSSIENEDPLGNNTLEVITRVKCPVLVIPEKAFYTRPNSVVFPTDFNLLFKNRVINTLCEILKTNKSALRILNIRKRNEDLSQLQKKNKEFLLDSLLHIQYSLHSPVHSSIEKALQDFIDSNPVDLIAMVAKNLNFFHRILFRPLTSGISYHKKIPILVLHE